MKKLAEVELQAARDLMSICRDLEGARAAFCGAEPPYLYIAQFRETDARVRVAVITVVVRLPGNRIQMATAGGETIVLAAEQIESWEPVVPRDNEPLPDGWWR